MIGQSDETYAPDSPAYAIFWLLKVGEPEDWPRLWTGDGDFALSADAVDTTGGTYKSVGFPAGIEAFGQVINGASENIQFSLSGVDATAMRLAGVDRDAVNGSEIHIGMMDFDEFAQPTGPCDWLVELIAGKPRVRREGRDSGAVRTISLPATGGMKDRNMAGFAFWTGASQRRRSSDDAFCDRVTLYTKESTVKWPF